MRKGPPAGRRPLSVGVRGFFRVLRASVPVVEMVGTAQGRTVFDDDDLEDFEVGEELVGLAVPSRQLVCLSLNMHSRSRAKTR